MKRDGTIGQCPVCSATLPATKDIYGETACPRCTAQLWHLGFVSGPAFFVRRPSETIYDLLACVAGDGCSASEIECTLRDTDTLDLAEFLSEFEDAVRS